MEVLDLLLARRSEAPAWCIGLPLLRTNWPDALKVDDPRLTLLEGAFMSTNTARMVCSILSEPLSFTLCHPPPVMWVRSGEVLSLEQMSRRVQHQRLSDSNQHRSLRISTIIPDWPLHNLSGLLLESEPLFRSSHHPTTCWGKMVAWE